MNCPYNHNHVFKKEKFLKHLEHCSNKKYTNKKLYKCKIDSFIRFFKEEKEEHYAKCTCRKINSNQKEKENETTIDNNNQTCSEEMSILCQINSSEDFEKSFQNASIKTDDNWCVDKENQSTIDLITETKLY